MSVMLVGSSIVTTMLIPPEAVRAGRRSVRPRARLPRARASRRRVRHALRPQHGRDPLVRRRVGDGRSAEPRAAVPAALRHGAGVGAGEPAAGAHLHRHHVPRHDAVQGRRRRAGRRLRDRRAGADGIGRARGHARRARAAAGMWLGYLAADAHLRLHDARQHRRAAGRPQDRDLFIVAIVGTSLVSRVLRSTELRVQAVEPDATALAASSRGAATARSASSPTGRTADCRRNTSTSCAKPASRTT